MAELDTPHEFDFETEKLRMLALHPFDFDQTMLGWRSLLGKIPEEHIAELILTFMQTRAADLDMPNADGKRLNPSMLPFHAAQCYLMSGNDHTAKVLPLLEQSKNTSEYGPGWNAYVDATTGFLTRDIARVEQALTIIEKHGHDMEKQTNGRIVSRFLEGLKSGNYSYKDAYNYSQ